MQKSREKGDNIYNGARISLYSDYSPDLQKRRAGFTDIKCSLRTYKIPYTLLYPARLRIEALGAIHFFFILLVGSQNGLKITKRTFRAGVQRV